MLTTTRVKIIRIGNSRGVRIPNSFLKTAQLEGEVELLLEENKLIIQRARNAREGWAAAFAEMARNGDDALLDNEAMAMTEWEKDNWTW